MAESQSHPSETRWRDLRTGILFVVGIALAGTLGLIIGKNTGILVRHDTAHIFLADIKGLTEGNMVTISGKKVGTVALMKFETHHDTSGVCVDLDIRDEFFQLITDDSHVFIKSLGVLGDKYVDIQLGRSERPLRDGGWLSASHTPGVEELTNSALETMGHISDISARINRGEGTVGRLIASSELADKLLATATNVEQITRRINSGEGLAGKVLADKHLASSAMGLVDSLHAIASDLRTGKGTAGALLRDSSLYAGMRGVLQRSDSLLAHLDSPHGTTGRFIHDSTAYVELSRTLMALDSLLVDFKEHPSRYVKVSVF